MTPDELVKHWRKVADEYSWSEDPDGFTSEDVAIAYRRTARQLEQALIDEQQARFEACNPVRSR